MVKIDTREPLIYGLVLAALLGIRIWWREQERRRQEAGAYGRNMAARVITITPRR
jgi:sulfoxide reductase heme-binding subunit YedZ